MLFFLGSSRVIGCFFCFVFFLRSHSQQHSGDRCEAFWCMWWFSSFLLFFFAFFFFFFFLTPPNSHHALLKRAASPRLLHLSPAPLCLLLHSGTDFAATSPLQKIIAWIIDHGWSNAQETDSNHYSISTPALCLSSHALSPLRLMFWFPPCRASSLFSFKFKCMLSVMNLQ